MSASEFIVPAGGGGDGGELELLGFLADRLGLSRKKAKAVIDSRRVFVNRRRAWMAAYSLKAGDRVEVEDTALGAAMAGPAQSKASFTRKSVLFEDEHYIVVAKPAGVESVGEDGLEAPIRKSFCQKSICSVHRLDRDTSGALLLARTREAFQKAVDMFKEKKIRKTYLALVHGQCRELQTIEKPVNNALALSRITRILASNRVASLLEVEIETGRKHQVRVHLASIGFPVAGDTKYISGRINRDELRRVPRQMIHASALVFEHPYTGREVSVRAALPPDFKACLAEVGLDGGGSE